MSERTLCAVLRDRGSDMTIGVAIVPRCRHWSQFSRARTPPTSRCPDYSYAANCGTVRLITRTPSIRLEPHVPAGPLRGDPDPGVARADPRASAGDAGDARRSR